VIKRLGISSACSIHEELRNVQRILVENVKVAKNYTGELSIGWSIILKFILRK
jgi:hypothetical protein